MPYKHKYVKRICSSCGEEVEVLLSSSKRNYKYCSKCYNNSRHQNEFTILEDKVKLTIITEKEKVDVFFDLKFYDIFSKLYWSIDYKCGKFYVRCGTRKYKVRPMHRLVCLLEYGEEAIKGKVIDHFNGDIYDNTLSNLKIVTQKENNINKKGAQSNNKSTGERGIYKQRNGSFSVELNRKYFGLYKTIEEAIIARDRAMEQEFGFYLNEQ